MTKSNQCIRVGVFSDILTEIPSFSSRPLLMHSFSLRFTIEGSLVSSRVALSLLFVAPCLWVCLCFPHGAIYSCNYGALTRVNRTRKKARACSVVVEMVLLFRCLSRDLFLSPLQKIAVECISFGSINTRIKDNDFTILTKTVLHGNGRLGPLPPPSLR